MRKEMVSFVRQQNNVPVTIWFVYKMEILLEQWVMGIADAIVRMAGVPQTLGVRGTF